MATNQSVADLEKLKVPDLRKLCKEHGLTNTGKKDELLARLKEFYSGVDENVLEESGEGTEELGDESVDDVNEDLLNEEDHAVGTTETKTTEPKENDQPAPKAITITKITVDKSETTTSKPVTTLSAEERLALRAKKFGSSSLDSKKAARAERFGLSNSSSDTSKPAKLSTEGTTVDVERLKERAKRFGTVTSTTLSSVDSQEKLQKRKERFGVENPDDKLKKRQERFGVVTSPTNDTKKRPLNTSNSSAEEAKKRRAERFGLVN